MKPFSSKKRHEIEETISHWLSSSIYYPSPVGLVKVHTDNTPLCIEVSHSNNGPYCLDGHIYIRNNSESIRASNERTLKMLATQKLNIYDKTKSANQKLTFDYLKNQFTQNGLEFKPEALGFYTNQNHDFTNVAFLTSDQNSYPVKIAVFDGLTVARFNDRKEIIGPIPKQIDDALTFLNLVNPLSTQITGQAKHQEQHGYPPVAIREALLNALSHRSYIGHGPVQIEVFDDRLTILSPGPLPGGLKLEAIINGQTMPRNPLIVGLLSHLHYIENYGTGVRRILDSYKSSDFQPVIDPEEDFVKVTLPNRNYVAKAPAPTHVNVLSTNQPGTVTIVVDDQGRIIEYLKTHHFITRSQVEKLLNVKRSQAASYLTKLTKQNIIQKVGSGPRTRYKLVQDILNQ